MPKIVTVEQMRAIEKAADASGLSYDQMMENAGQAVAKAMISRWPALESGLKVTILVGPGNNGGDGLVAGHYLAEAGAQVAVYLAKERPEGDLNLERMRQHGGLIAAASQDQRYRVLKNLIETSDALIDALLGTGFKLPLKGSLQELMGVVKTEIERRSTPIATAAVDCPSGLDCDTGEIAPESFHADLSVTLAAAKPGLLTFPGAEFAGEVEVADIGILPNQKELKNIDLELATQEVVKPMLPPRPQNAHKGTFGKAILVAGSANFPGAALLAGLGAYRVGAGLVTLASPSIVQGMLVSQIPEATWLVLPHEMGAIAEAAADVLLKELPGYQALLFGPGFGRDPATRRFIQSLLGNAGAGGKAGRIGFIHNRESGSDQGEEYSLPPCVVDADGLKLLTEIENWPDLLPGSSILTPHPGEMSILTREPIAQIQAARTDTAQRWAKEWGHIVVLKGAFTVVAAPDGRIMVIPFATSALATAGTGDVLAGATVGLLAQGLEPFQAAVLACWLHGQAGVMAADWAGSTASVIAGDVAEALMAAVAELSA